MVKMKLYNYSAIHETLPFLWAQPVKQIDEGVFLVPKDFASECFIWMVAGPWDY